MSTTVAMPPLPAYDENKDRPPFLSAGTFELEVVDAKASHTFKGNTPFYAVDAKVLKSSTPAHPVGSKATIFIKCNGFSYANKVYGLFSAITGHAPSKLSTEAIAVFLGALKVKLIGRKFSTVMTIESKIKNGVTQSWPEYVFGSLDSSPIALS